MPPSDRMGRPCRACGIDCAHDLGRWPRLVWDAPLALRARVRRCEEVWPFVARGRRNGARVFLPASCRVMPPRDRMGRPCRACGIDASITWAVGPGGYGTRRWRCGPGCAGAKRSGHLSQCGRRKGARVFLPASCRVMPPGDRMGLPYRACGIDCAHNLGRWPRLVWGAPLALRAPVGRCEKVWPFGHSRPDERTAGFPAHVVLSRGAGETQNGLAFGRIRRFRGRNPGSFRG